MALIDKPPHIKILEAVVATLQLVDFADRAGVANVTVRHRRHRFSSKAERPCIAPRWTGDDDGSPDGGMLTEWERQKLCNVDLEIDTDLSTESSETDPTGWGQQSRLAAAAYDALAAEDSPMRAVSDWIRRGSDAPDDDSKPDEGRLVSSIVVVYRVRSDDPNVLLAPGENG